MISACALVREILLTVIRPLLSVQAFVLILFYGAVMTGGPVLAQEVSLRDDAPTVGSPSDFPQIIDEDNERWNARLWRTLLLQDYNTRVVLLGTILLGICAGVVGTFMVLRQRAL
ncbi:MAG: hypothetical protein KDA65_19760, partial [Planctomycetaceae bacterium]|nr:hypothetical protein [Planctomycetaceae bacterium]